MPQEPVEKPDPYQTRDAKLKHALDDARKNYNSVILDGKNITQDQNTNAAAHSLNKLSEDLINMFFDKIEEVKRESAGRKEVWLNPLTRPTRKEEFPVHYILSIDTKLEWIDTDWTTCDHKDCPENVEPR